MLRRLIVVGLLAAWPLAADARDLQREPEAATGTADKSLVTADRHMVVAAHPLAAEAGRDMLRKGGSAVDAAIATQLVLGLVEPQSSGLGGGAFIVHWANAARSVTTYDGRETAPASAKPDRFVVNGEPMDFPDAVRSGLSVGVPGVVRAMELAHGKHGKLAWADLFAPAITLADSGFALPSRLHDLLKWEGAEAFAPDARRYFFNDDGTPKTAGTIVKNPDYAATLRAIASGGSKAFYEGPIADAILAAVAAAPIAKSDLTAADLAGYQAKERAALCFAYRARKLCGMGPPSSGAITIAQTLKLIEPFSEVPGADNAMRASALHVIAEAEKLAYADRNRYLADPDFVAVPDGLLDDGYLAERRKLINVNAAMERPEAGLPPGIAKRTFGVDATYEVAGTSHLSVVDDQGNAVAMTTTIEGAFGSHLWAAGFLLNNELTDFSLVPAGRDGVVAANAVAGGKRPRSSMSPMLIFDANGALEGVTGSPGGSRIIMFVTKTLIAMLDWGMDAQQAAALPNFGSDGGALAFEPSVSFVLKAIALKSYGHTLNAEYMTSGVHTILRRNGKLEGGADPRREGVALGD
ncbi:MAG: gamma-glutamyltransferase [Hyphomicrobium sp.]|nr:gamma-glutamyltransferase [Hyphomicrobium sp.]